MSLPERIVALDVGGTRVKWGLVNPAGRRVLASGASSSESSADRATVLGALSAAIHAASAGEAVVDLAIAFPAPFDYAVGTPLLEHKFASIHGLDLAAELTSRSPQIARASFWNDAQAAAVGEARLGAATDATRVLVITLGTGVGSAFVVDGQPIDDVDGWEVGTLWAHDGPLGRIDDRFSVVAMCRAVNTPVADLHAAIGSPDHAEAFARFGSDLGDALLPYVAQTGADMVLFAGGGALAFPAFEVGLASTLPCTVRAGTLGDAAAILGVCELHTERRGAAAD